MCNRYRMTASRALLAQRYGIKLPVEENVNLPPPELFPKKRGWIVRGLDGEKVLDVMSWGFPHTVKGASGKLIEKPVTNVRNLGSPFWRSALLAPTRRCLVPVTAFSEYGPGAPGKLPLFWFDVPSRPIFSFAGVWRPLGEGKGAFAFLTTEPNALVGAVHPKEMPVLLHQEDEDRWLSEPIESALDLVAAYPSQLMEISEGGPRQVESFDNISYVK